MEMMGPIGRYGTFKWKFHVIGLLLIFNQFFYGLNGLELEGCDLPLGMESGKIKDSSVAASSAYDSSSVGAHHARLRNNKQGGAWCPRHMVSRDSREYLEVDLDSLHVVTSLMTQGRYGNGQGQEYAEQYLVEYYRVALKKWVRWKDRSGKELLTGNTDTLTINEQKLDPSIIAQKIRLLPYSDHVRTVCMRIEILGCPFKDNLLSYSIPQGIRRGADLDLSDRLYDGTEESGHLSHGLGQLVDGQKGRDNFRLDLTGLGKGYEWVGWRNDTPGWSGLPLEMIFEFSHVRNFSAAHLYTNNQFTKDVQVFSHARAFLSLNGVNFSPEAVHFSYMPDLVMEHSRNVTIKLHNRVGRFLKLQLYFASKWILISEVSFTSVSAKGNFTVEAEAEGITEYESDSLNIGREYSLQRDEVKMTVAKGSARNVIRGVSFSETNQKTPESSKGYIGLVIGILTVIILVLVSAIVFIVYRNQRLKTALTKFPIHGEANERMQNGKIPIEDLQKESTIYTESSRSTMYDRTVPASLVPEYSAQPLKRFSLTPNQTDKIYSSTTLEPPAPPVPPPPRNYYSSGELYKTLVSLERTEIGKISPKIRKRASSGCTNPFLNPQEPDLTFREFSEDLDNFNGINVIKNIDHFIQIEDRSEKQLENVDVHAKNDRSIVERNNKNSVKIRNVVSDNVKFIEKIGSGIFGDVNLCEVAEEESSDFIVSNSDFRLVVVYELKRGEFLDDFKSEVQTLAHLDDPNIALMLGASLNLPPDTSAPIFAIREYTPYGDLCQFLQDHVAESATPLVGSTASTLSYGCLIFMATQIASGMKYLESQRYVHKDLATRNCLVGCNHQIKISDLGAYRDIYSADYFQMDEKTRRLPIRWMAWEGVLLDKCSSRSDVWSFAVLLWEILTFAREQPFDELADEGVIENLQKYYQNAGEHSLLTNKPPAQPHGVTQTKRVSSVPGLTCNGDRSTIEGTIEFTNKHTFGFNKVTLPIPFNCPREIYDLMLECWQRNESNRPSFREIHLFLQRKNLGYCSGMYSSEKR